MHLRMTGTWALSCVFLGVCSVASLGCSKAEVARNQIPMVASIHTILGSKPGAVVTEVTLKKSQILDREFLYGADIQYSSMGDVEYSLVLQALSLGHFDARFRLVQGSVRGGGQARLQLVADQRAYYESDINHPERLIHEFRVIRQDAQTITIALERGSSVLVSLLGDQEASVRSSWIRSVQYEPRGNYLMFESSIEDSKGNIVEYMESVFPRETLVAGSDSTFKPILNDRGRESMAERFRFLSAGAIFMDLPGEGRVRTAIAQRFRYHPTEAPDPIVWHVTPNIPDAYLADLKNGIEAWNRYSQAMWGKDLVEFAGKLPDGIKIGDPRYNVVSWDSVAEAGAAYESQSADPRTGLQSHSLIYLPNAWLNIGRTYWEQGDLSSQTSRLLKSEAKLEALRSRKLLGRSLPIHCIQEAAAKLSLEARVDPETFARELLKGVIFHEVGHALGLSHNFKGSLSWNPEDPASVFSTSVMDYNQYVLERAAFENVDSKNGVLLEYDRQILSVLYNGGADLQATDPVLPACDDDEADSWLGGGDPLCIRYDSGRDPTAQLLNTIRLVTDPAYRLGTADSLPVALSRLTAELGDPALATDIPTAVSSITRLAQKMAGIVNFYYVMGAQSIAALARDGVKPLHVIRGELPSYLNETLLRQQAMSGVEWVLSQKSLSQPTENALQAVISGASSWLEKTPAFAGVGDKTDPRRAIFDGLVELLRTIQAQFSSTGDASTLAYLRGAVLSALVREDGAPYFFEVSDQGIFDVEAKVLTWLEQAVTEPRAFRERGVALGSLKTFKGTESGDLTLGRVRSALNQQLRAVKNAQEREQVRKLLALLGPA